MPILLLFMAMMAHAAEWGTPVNGLRLSLAVDSEASHLTFTFENVEERREMFLLLGTVGVNEASYVKLFLATPGGKRAPLLYTGGNGIAPGRIVPMIVPLLAGSTYSLRTPLNRWYRANQVPLTPAMLREGVFQAEISQPKDMDLHLFDCFGLRIFWSGTLRSNLLRFASNLRK